MISRSFILFVLFLSNYSFCYAQKLRKSSVGAVESGAVQDNGRFLEEANDAWSDEEDGELIEPPNRGRPDKKIAPPEIRGEKRTVQNLLMNFQLAKARLLESIKGEYGEYFETLFIDHEPAMKMPNNQTTCTVGRNAFIKGSQAAEVSWKRTVRKMKMNLLQYLIEGEVQDFVWATAGNAAAAGYGNFFDQQYSIVLQDKAWDLFHSLGLDLVVRPYGMGQATSAPEIAGCAKEIFGVDVDIITWDFAMTDGRMHWRAEFFAHRVMMLPNRPIMLMLQAGVEEERIRLVDHLTEQKMGVLRQDERYLVMRKLLAPDSRNQNAEYLNSLPDRLRYFRCGFGIETGLGCLENRFTMNGTCDERPHRTNWHKGWKWHAFQGNVYALFLMEIAEDALHELSLSGLDPTSLPVNDLALHYRQLEKEQEEEFRAFEAEADLMYEYEWSILDIKAIQLYRDPTYCHTASLPAQTRFLGHVINEERYDNWFSYVQGETMKRLRLYPDRNILLGRAPPPKEHKCNATLTIDKDDFFLADGRFEGYQRITFPTDAELKAYDSHETSGILALCSTACSNECAGSPLITPEYIRKGQVAMRVNGEPVFDVEKFDNCFLLKHRSGSLHWPSNHENTYDIEVNVKNSFKYIRFTSFILW